MGGYSALTGAGYGRSCACENATTGPVQAPVQAKPVRVSKVKVDQNCPELVIVRDGNPRKKALELIHHSGLVARAQIPILRTTT